MSHHGHPNPQTCPSISKKPPQVTRNCHLLTPPGQAPLLCLDLGQKWFPSTCAPSLHTHYCHPTATSCTLDHPCELVPPPELWFSGPLPHQHRLLLLLRILPFVSHPPHTHRLVTGHCRDTNPFLSSISTFSSAMAARLQALPNRGPSSGLAGSRVPGPPTLPPTEGDPCAGCPPPQHLSVPHALGSSGPHTLLHPSPTRAQELGTCAHQES